MRLYKILGFKTSSSKSKSVLHRHFQISIPISLPVPQPPPPGSLRTRRVFSTIYLDMYFFSASYESILPHPTGHSDKPEGKTTCVQDRVCYRVLCTTIMKGHFVLLLIAPLDPEKVDSETALKHTPL